MACFITPTVQLSTSPGFSDTFQSHSQPASVPWRVHDALKQGKAPFMPSVPSSSAGHLLSVQRPWVMIGPLSLSLILRTQSSVCDRRVTNARCIGFLTPLQAISPGFSGQLHKNYGQFFGSPDWPLCSFQCSRLTTAGSYCDISLAKSPMPWIP